MRTVWIRFFSASLGIHLGIGALICFVSNRTKQYAFTVHQVIDLRSAHVVLRPATFPSGASASAVAQIPGVKTSVAPARQVADGGRAKKTEKKVVKKKAAKTAPKKPVKKPIAQKKSEVKKNKKPEAVQKKEPEKKIPPQPVTPVVEPVVPPAAKPVAADMGPIEISYADVSLANQYQQLHQELVKYWAPPPGIADDCACTVRISIDRNGQIDDLLIERPSGVLMFDITTRTALLAVSWPRWAWGSALTITFKP